MSAGAAPGSPSRAEDGFIAAVAAEEALFDLAMAEINHGFAALETLREWLSSTRAALIVARQRELAIRTAAPAPDAAP